MNARTLGFVALASIAIRSAAATLMYQPSPYKGSDVWVTNKWSYDDDYGVNSDRLRVGGWGDWYWSAIKFDIEGLPSNPTSVGLYLWALSSGDGSSPVEVNVYSLANAWDESSGWYSTKWSGTYLGRLPAPTIGRWNGMGITAQYRQWKNGSLANNGILLSPNSNDNRFNSYFSSEYAYSYFRPFIWIEYAETTIAPRLKLPLPGGRSWVVTTEIGGRDAKHPTPYTKAGAFDEEYLDTAHTEHNYFSIDFGAESYPAFYGDIPIYAAAAGKVYFAGGSDLVDNGYHVVIDHDADGDIATGYSTRYLHFKYWPSVRSGEVVAQGQLLGYMGNTGKSKGTHLHFGVRYRNAGYSNLDELAFVKLEGQPLKQYQTEVDASGVRSWNSYYPSTNTK